MEYIELREGQFDKVYIHSEDEIVPTNFYWYSGKMKVINKFAKDGWHVVGYAQDSVLMGREKKTASAE